MKEKNWGVEAATLPKDYFDAQKETVTEQSAVHSQNDEKVAVRPVEVQEEYDMT